MILSYTLLGKAENYSIKEHVIKRVKRLLQLHKKTSGEQIAGGLKN